MPTLPYIHFQGQCAEALAFYDSVFGGGGVQTMRYADGPEVPPAWRESARIMHGQVTLFDGTLMASDYPPDVAGDPQSGFSVMQSAPDIDTGRKVFEALAEGGAIVTPFTATFFSPGFGMVKDRFGTHWIISTTPAP